MAESNTLDALKQGFEKVVPVVDRRTEVGPLSFVVCLVHCYFGDSKTFSLEAIRRFMMKQTGTKIKRSAFWERLGTARLGGFLNGVVVELMGRLKTTVGVGKALLEKLGVSGIVLVDSSSITLPDAAKGSWPGTRTSAGIKWHLAFDVLSGMMVWFQTTPTKVHDSNCFPEISSLVGKLVVFDLGYWDYGLLLALENARVFFLSRVKSNSVIMIKKVVKGLPKGYAGRSLFSVPLTRFRGRVVDVFIEKMHKGETLACRVVGFWNPHEGCYHWYATNLVAAAAIMYPLYRLRWQIELVFKSCKNSLNANEIPSAKKEIIQNLLLASIAAHLSSYTIFSIGLENLFEEQKLAVSVQRVAMVAVVLAEDFVNFLLRPSRKFYRKLLNLIKLFSDELFDPNYKNRETTIARLNRMLEEGA